MRGVAILVVLLAVFVVAAKVLLPAEKVRDLALAQAESRLGRQVSVGEVDVSLQGGLGVRLADFVVHNPEGFAGDPLVATKSLDLKLALGPLIKGEIRINRLVVESPVVNLVRLADGRDNFSFESLNDSAEVENETTSEAAAAAPPPMSVANLTLREGQITFTDAAAGDDGGQTMQLSGMTLGLSLADPAPGQFAVTGRLSAAKIEVSGPDPLPELQAALDFSMIWDANLSQLEIKQFDVTANEIALAVGGRLLLRPEEAPVGDLALQLPATKLNLLASFLPAETTAMLASESDPAGQLSGVVDLVLGADETVGAKGNLVVEGLALAVPDMPILNSTVNFDVTWQGAAAQLDLNQVQATLNDLPLTASGQVLLNTDVPKGKIQVQGKDLALVDLARFLPAELASLVQGSRESGLANAEVEVTLTGEQDVPMRSSGKVSVTNVDLALAQAFLPPDQPGIIAGRGDLVLDFAVAGDKPADVTYAGTFRGREISFTESGLVDELENLDASLSFTQDRVTVESCQAKFASGEFSLTGNLRDPFPYFLPPEMQGDAEMKTPHLEFDLRSPRLDVDRMLPAASPSGNNGAAKTAGSAKAPVPLDMEFPGLSCDGTFSADSLIYMEVPLTTVTGLVKLRERKFDVYDVKGRVYHGTVAGQMAVDLNDLNDPVFNGQYQATEIEVDNFVTRFAGLAGVVFGGCNLGGSFDAHGLDPESIRNSLSLNADADIKQGKVVTSGNVHSALSGLASQAGQTLNHEQALRDLAAHISVENGRVGISAMKTRLGQFGDVTIDGYYGFNGDLDYRGTVLLTEAQTSQLFNGSSLLRELGKLLGSERPARLALPLSVGGTRLKPKVKLDLGAVTNDLQKLAVKEQGRRLEDEAKDKLGDLLKKWK